MNANQTLTVGQCATLACLLEVAAPKVGNVHRGADFPNLRLQDMLASAVAVGPAMETAGNVKVGTTVLRAIKATRRVTATNSNLGIVLLLAPLAASATGGDLHAGVRVTLSQLQPEDAADVYAAINLAEPGGMGQVAEMDIAGPPPDDLLAAMRAASDGDLVARQYVDGFGDVFVRVCPWLFGEYASDATPPSLSDRIVRAHVRLIAELGDTLIHRKAGAATAREASDRAAEVLAAGDICDDDYHRALADFDFWLRSDGTRRNPGATADLVAAGLFVGLWEAKIEGPFR